MLFIHGALCCNFSFQKLHSYINTIITNCNCKIGYHLAQWLMCKLKVTCSAEGGSELTISSCHFKFLRGQKHPISLIQYHPLSLGPKHPIRDKFNEMHFFVCVDSIVCELRQNITDCENLFEIESLVKWFTGKVRE